MRLGQGIHILGPDPQQGSHLIDESPRASGTGAVHPGFHTAAVQKENLGVLAAQLYNTVGTGDVPLRGHLGGVDLLNKGNAALLRHAHAR